MLASGPRDYVSKMTKVSFSLMNLNETNLNLDYVLFFSRDKSRNIRFLLTHPVYPMCIILVSLTFHYFKPVMPVINR